MNAAKYQEIVEEITPYGARLVAVSKKRPAAEVLELYQSGQRIFGENKPQELASKRELLPANIEWHMIGHLQTNKVKLIAPFVTLIHSVDSLKLLIEINKQAQKNNRVIDCLLQIFIADEETKYGFSRNELIDLLSGQEFEEMKNSRVCGLMGMATNTEDVDKIAAEFGSLQSLFIEIKNKFFANQAQFRELSMGMSSDYKIALKHGATLVRLGSVLFGG